LAIKSCKIALNLDKHASYRNEKVGDPTLLGDMAEILFESGDLEGAYEKARLGLS